MSSNQPIYPEAAHAEVDQRLRTAATARRRRKDRTLALLHRRSASHRAG